jgi:serine/threonine protein kinase
VTRGSGSAPYEIVAPLGAGGMGEVYRERDKRLKPNAALRVLMGRPTRIRRASALPSQCGLNDDIFMATGGGWA